MKIIQNFSSIKMDINNFQPEKRQNTDPNKLHTDFMNKMNDFKNDLNEFGRQINLLKKEHLELETEILKGLVELEDVSEELVSIEKSVTKHLVRIKEVQHLEKSS